MEQTFFKWGFASGGIWNLTPRETIEECEKGAVLIDVREEYMNRFKMFGVPNVIYCPNSILAEMYADLPADKSMIFADAAGIHSKEAVSLLIGKGLGERVANMAGGLVEWERDGLPLVINKSERLSGSCMCMLRPREK